MNLSKPTAQFLLGLVNAQQLSVGAPDFDEAVAAILRARQELQAALDEAEPNPRSG